jgi:hypothetical protein
MDGDVKGVGWICLTDGGGGVGVEGFQQCYGEVGSEGTWFV